MQSHCLALRSQLVPEYQSWKGPVCRDRLSQLLLQRCYLHTEEGQGLRKGQGHPGGPGLVLCSPPPLHRLGVDVTVRVCVCDVWCECRGVPRVGGYLALTVSAQS